MNFTETETIRYMKRLLILCLMLGVALSVACVYAQSGLNIAGAFTPRYRELPEATETIVSKSRLRNLSLSVYHTLSITGHPEIAAELEDMVMRDGAKARSKEVRYASGHLYYGFYALPPVDGLNRYILYLNGHLKSSDRIMLLYIEGKASIEDVKKLINPKRQ